MKEKSMVVERRGEIGQAEEERALKKKKKKKILKTTYGREEGLLGLAHEI